MDDYIADMPPISPYLLDRVEQALSIKLYAWQRAYLQDKYYDVKQASGRQTGKTLAYIIKRLLTPYAISKDEIRHYSDKAVQSRQYNEWFGCWALEINEKLTAAGIKTCIVD